MLRLLGSYNLMSLRGLLRRVFVAVDGCLFEEQTAAFILEGIKRKKVQRANDKQ